jgi:hypothetical protein
MSITIEAALAEIRAAERKIQDVLIELNAKTGLVPSAVTVEVLEHRMNNGLKTALVKNVDIEIRL